MPQYTEEEEPRLGARLVDARTKRLPGIPVGGRLEADRPGPVLGAIRKGFETVFAGAPTPVSKGVRARTPEGTGFMQIQAEPRISLDQAGVRQDVPPRPAGAVAVTEVPTLEEAAAEGRKSFGFVQAGPSDALPAPPPAPQPTGNFTADLINKAIYNKRLASYNKQVAAQRTAKAEAARFGAKEKREAALAESQIRQREVETAAKLAETRPVRADFATQAEFDTALKEWRRDFGAKSAETTIPEETKESFRSFL